MMTSSIAEVTQMADQWEYRVVTLNLTSDSPVPEERNTWTDGRTRSRDASEILNVWGLEEWELVNAQQFGTGAFVDNHQVCFFKRRKP